MSDFQFFEEAAVGLTLAEQEAVLDEREAARGEQPDEVALPLAGALRGDTPISITERSEV